MGNLADKLNIIYEKPLVIIHGKNNVGKTIFVHKAFENSKYFYFQFKEEKNSFEEIFNNLKINYDNSKIYQDSYVLEKLNNLLNKYILIFDNLEKMNKEMLSIFFNLSMNLLKNEKNGKIIVIYNDGEIKKGLKQMINLLIIQGAYEIKIDKPTYKEFCDLIRIMGYNIPEKVLKLIYKATEGNFNLLQEIISELEKNKFIMEKLFIKNVSYEGIEEIKNLISNIISIKFKIDDINFKEKEIIYILDTLGKATEDEIKQISETDNIKTYLEKLLRLKIIFRNKKYYFLKKPIKIILYENNLYAKLANYYELKGKFDKAGHFYYLSGNLEKAKSLLCNKISSKIDIINIKLCYNITKKPSLAEKLLKYYEYNDRFDDLLDLSKSLYFKYPNKIKFKIYYAKALYLKNNLNDSLKIFKQVLKNTKSKKYILESLYGIKEIYYKKEDFNKAMDFSLKTLKLAIRLNDKEKEAETYKVIGNIYYFNFNDNIAKEYYEKALKIYEEINDDKGKACLYVNIGNIYSENNIKKSFEYYEKALKISEKNWWLTLIIPLNINKGIMLNFLGDINGALYSERTSAGLALAINDYESATTAFTVLFELQLLIGNFNEAKEIVKLGLEVSKKYPAKNTYKIFRMFKLILETFNGKSIDINMVKKTFIENIPHDTELSIYFTCKLLFFAGNIQGYIDEFKKNLSKYENQMRISDLLEVLDFIEAFLYLNYFKNDNYDINDILSKINKIEDINDLNLFKWRLNIIDAILKIDKKDTKVLFVENINKIKNANLEFLSAKLKIIYGLFYYRKNKNKSILEEGIKDLKNIKAPGLLNIFREALEI